MKKIPALTVIALLVFIFGVFRLTAAPTKPTDLPSAPATPTRAENQDQLDKEQQERIKGLITPLPTQTPYPGYVTPEPPPENPETAAHPERWATAVPLPPSDTWTTYKDPNLGFSFDYPSNWVISEPDGKFSPTNPDYRLAIENFDPNKPVKNANGHLKIEIMVMQKPASFTSPDQWVHSSFHPETKFDEVEPLHSKAGDIQRWNVNGPTLVDGASIMVLEVGEKIYVISYAPQTSKYMDAVEKILTSFALQ
ncbi:MAG: hypothetical protein U0350_25815 [Caldilineaceae bacterium]